MQVDFFIAGAPKCGTTALAAYLAGHRDVCFSLPKEPHFFCSETLAPASREAKYAEYHKRFFSHYNEKEHKVVGEGTPQYLYYPNALPAILEYNPSARFIVMLRNPVDMVFSWHREMLRGLVENAVDIQAAWALQSERAQGKRLPENCTKPLHLQYRGVCMLGAQIERLFSYVDRRNVLVVLMDDLRETPLEVYRKVCSFIEVEDDGKNDFPTVHSGVEWRSKKLISLYNLAYTIKRKVIGDAPIPFSVDARLKSRLMRKAVETERDPVFVQMLMREFMDDVRKLERLIDRDLSSWI